MLDLTSYRTPEYSEYLSKQAAPEPEDNGDGSSSSSEYSSEDESSETWKTLPISHNIYFHPNTPKITSAVLTETSFMVSAAQNAFYTYDFSKVYGKYLNESLGLLNKPSSETQAPEEAHVTKLIRQPGSENVLCLLNAPRFTFFRRRDSGGLELDTDFRPGNPYLKDLKHTFGHVKSPEDADFDVKNSSILATCSSDDTIRTWDMLRYLQLQNLVTCVRVDQCHVVRYGSRCARSKMGLNIACGSGKFVKWFDARTMARPSISSEVLKEPVVGITLANLLGDIFWTQSALGEVSKMDLRAPQKPILSAKLTRRGKSHPEIYVSPNDEYILMAVDNYVKVLNGDLEEVASVKTKSEITTLLLNYKLNQIIWGDVSGGVGFGFSERSFEGILRNLDKTVDVGGIKRRIAHDEEIIAKKLKALY